MRVLGAKLTRIALITAAFLVALSAVGIDLTALAVFGGALGVGLGFGLQKIFSNLVSGVILLMDRSIKPGDVIAVGTSFGWINHLGARYASVITRDGIEHLIPNEELITQRVENWSYSNDLVRLRIPIGISYHSDPRLAIRLCVEAAEMIPRVQLKPEPRCQMMGFGDSSLDLELRVWIDDPQNGRANVISEVLLGVWDRFHEHGIEIPFPQRDLHLRSVLGEEELQSLAAALLGAQPQGGAA
jgi:small-conductance mechanosensitive channel